MTLTDTATAAQEAASISTEGLIGDLALILIPDTYTHLTLPTIRLV